VYACASNDDEYNITATTIEKKSESYYQSDSNISAKEMTDYTSENANKSECIENPTGSKKAG
jgi:hypothetical protein